MTADELCARIRKPPTGTDYPGPPVPPIVCRDGFMMSVQADRWTYCTPRDDDGPWTAAEVGFPSEREELLMPHAEDPERPTNTVYGYVPVETVLAVIEKHGGVER